MDENKMKQIAEILGVSADSISAMDEEIQNSMTAVFETVTVKNDEDKKAVFEALDSLWQKGSIYIELAEVAKSTGISLDTLRSLDYETQQAIVYEFLMDSSQTARFYDIVNKALAVADLPNDMVFDGDDWVHHEGVVYSGDKDVISWDGITASEEHMVFIDSKTKVTLKEAKEKGKKLWRGNMKKLQ